MSYIAAIDIGSNAIRLAIAHHTPNGLHISYRSREPVRLGSSVFSLGHIDKDSQKDLELALKQFKNQMENFNVLKFRATATSAMREASNGKEVIKKLRKSTGIEVDLISGEEEARLVAKAISQKIELASGHFLFIDIGGGSIELVAMIDGEIRKKKSYVLGMVRVLELAKKKKEKLEKWFPQTIKEEMGDFFSDLPKLTQAVGTGGNMDRFVKLKSHVSSESGASLSYGNMKDLYKKLSEVDYNTRIEKFWLKPDRADVIIPAAIATLNIMKLSGSELIHFPQVGLKDGVLYELSSEG